MYFFFLVFGIPAQTLISFAETHQILCVILKILKENSGLLGIHVRFFRNSQLLIFVIFVIFEVFRRSLVFPKQSRWRAMDSRDSRQHSWDSQKGFFGFESPKFWTFHLHSFTMCVLSLIPLDSCQDS